LSFFEIHSSMIYNDISSEFRDSKFKDMLSALFKDNPYLYKVDSKLLYENLLAYKTNNNDELFYLFESPSKCSFSFFFQN